MFCIQIFRDIEVDLAHFFRIILGPHRKIRACKIFYFRLKRPVKIDMLDERQIIFLSQFPIVSAKGRGLMCDSRALVGRNKISRIYLPAVLSIFQRRVAGVVIEGWLVFETEKIASLYR